MVFFGCGAPQLAKSRPKVLIISTDPAHNISDAFGQKFSSKPTLADGFDNLYCMEIDPMQYNDEAAEEMLGGAASGMGSMLKDLTSAVPGIDEAMSFGELMKSVQSMDYSCIVFDTAPTGHTLRLLAFPSVLEKGLNKLLALKSKFGGVMSQVQAMMGGLGAGMPSQDMLLEKLESTKAIIEQVNAQFKDADRTTFICVCIPEFLSLYETERLVQELSKFGIDVHNIVVNQVLFPDAGHECGKCGARVRMQQKYLDQIYDLYEEFHVVTMPLLDAEVRGVPSLKSFCQYLQKPYVHDGVAAAKR